MTVATEQRTRSKREQLLEDGFCVFPNMLDAAMLQELTTVTENLLATYNPEVAQKVKYQGSNIKLDYQHSVFARLFAWPGAIKAFQELGFDSPKFWSAFLLSK